MWGFHNDRSSAPYDRRTAAAAFLREHSFPTGSVGFKYTVSAILIAYQSPELTVDEIYAKIAADAHITPTRVYRAITMEITEAWAVGAIFGNVRPTVAEFLEFAVNWLRADEATL